MTATNGDVPTLREVYQLIEAVKSELANQITRLKVDIAGDMALHRTEHERENDKRRSLVMWAVTSGLSGMGLLVLAWVNLRN